MNVAAVLDAISPIQDALPEPIKREFQAVGATPRLDILEDRQAVFGIIFRTRRWVQENYRKSDASESSEARREYMSGQRVQDA